MRRFLILEDDPDLRASLCELLLSSGADSCVCVASVGELVREADPREVDVAVLDVHLGPGAPSGHDALAWLLDHGFGGRAIFLTGHGRASPGTAAGASVLEKPVDPALLEALVTGEFR